MTDRFEGFGKYRRAVSARATDPGILNAGQDGGTTTALLCFARERGEIDGAVLTYRADEQWTPGQYVATTVEEIKKSAGSVYALSPNIFQLKDATREMGLENVAYVGLPCQVVAVRKLQLYPFGGRHVGERVKYVIGIFCSENFHPESLRVIAGGLGGLSLGEVQKMHIAGGKLLLEGAETAGVPVKQASRFSQDGDRVCPDLVAEYADISVGSIGAEPGWNTVFLRTRRGEGLFERAVADGGLEVREFPEGAKGLQLLQKMSLAKKKAAEETIEKREQLGLFVTRDMYY